MRRSWFAALCATTALMQAVYAAARVMISYRALDLGGSATTVGVLAALYALVPLVAAIPIGRAVDGRFAAAVLRSGSALAVVAVGIVAISGDIVVLAMGSILLGFSNILTMVASQGYVPALSAPGDYDRRFGGLTVWISIGQSIGIPVVGIIASRNASTGVNTTGPLLAMAVFAVVSTAITLMPALRIRKNDDDVSAGQDRQSTTAMLSAAGMRPAVFSSLIILTSMDLMTAYLPVFGEEHGFSVAVVTAILTARSVAAIVSRLLITRLLSVAPRSWLIISGSLCSAIPVAVIPLLPNAWAVTGCLAVAGFFWGLAQPLTMTWVAGLVTPHNRASALSLRLTGNRLGQVIIPVTAGTVAGSVGIASVFFLTAGLLAAAAASTTHALILRSPGR